MASNEAVLVMAWENTVAHKCGSPPHDYLSLLLSSFITIGLIASYLPQHWRIFSSKTSEGISPWFLLLGATSSASSLLNVLSLQWHVIRCCQSWGMGGCLENALGILQIFFQWLCFNIVLILFLIYYPISKKHIHVIPIDPANATAINRTHYRKSLFNRMKSNFWPSTAVSSISQSSSFSSSSSDFEPDQLPSGIIVRQSSLALSPSYRVALLIGVVTLVHLILSTIITFILLLTLTTYSDGPIEDEPHDDHRGSRAVRLWATFLGVLSTILAMIQYLPQIFHTAKARLVGSLSILMMCIQTPGSFVFVYSLAIRPGVNWTTWGVYLVTGILQGMLLVMCVVWKIRQKQHGIDDYGNDLRDSNLVANVAIRNRDEARPLLSGQMDG